MTNTQPHTETKAESKSNAKGKGKSNSGLPVFDEDQTGQAMMDAFVKSTEAYVDWLSVWNREVSNFLTRRLQRQRDFARKACACKDGADLVECQREWSMAAQQDYADEFRKLTELGLSFAEKQAANTQIGKE